VYDTPPAIRHEGENMIIPVVKEVAVIIKKYEVVEELHVTKTRTEVPQIQQVTLLKEEVEVRREATNNS
jgi:stress response protein YsnF